MVFYIVITIKVNKRNIACFNQFSCRSCKKQLNNDDVHFRQANVARSAENQQLLKRISIIILTDLICWMPLCIISLAFWHIPVFEHFKDLEEYLTFAIPYETVTLFLFSINSILNPFIYSLHLRRILCTR